jgi:hypothetical protein
MGNDPGTDIQTLWQKQPREPQRISLDEIRAKAEHFEINTRRWRTVGRAVVILLVIINVFEIMWPGQDIVERAGDLLTLGAFLYIWYEYRKHARIASRPEGLGLTNCVDFYRAALSHERNLAQQSRRYLLPFVPGVTLSLLGGVLDEAVPTARKIGVAALGVGLFLGVGWLNAHTARKLQRDIDTLEAL